jgi:hypothetical protein
MVYLQYTLDTGCLLILQIIYFAYVTYIRPHSNSPMLPWRQECHLDAISFCDEHRKMNAGDLLRQDCQLMYKKNIRMYSKLKLASEERKKWASAWFSRLAEDVDIGLDGQHICSLARSLKTSHRCPLVGVVFYKSNITHCCNPGLRFCHASC